MFTGLSAFPLTPHSDGRRDLDRFAELVSRLAAAGVDSIGALGSTGSYAYFTPEERRNAMQVAVDAAAGIPVIVGVGAVSLREVLRNIDAAQETGAAGILLAPLTYQPLTAEEVYGLYVDASAHSELPIVLYDNPDTTGVTFTDDLYSRIAHLPNLASIKIPALPADDEDARDRVVQLHALAGSDVTIGISGDSAAARGLIAGCDAWYSVLAGILPGNCLRLTRAAQLRDVTTVAAISKQLAPIWDLFAAHGSYRVTSAIADELGILRPESLHRPVLPLSGHARERVRDAVVALYEVD